MAPARLVDLRVGRVGKVAGHPTAYGKHSVSGPLAAGRLGLDGDEQANRKVHGGPDKAIYAYAAGTLAAWRADHPQHAARLVAGAFGENLLIDGIDETDVCLGDRYRIGTAVVEVAQPRQPCATLGRWFADTKMADALVRTGRSGWYLRVIAPGVMAPGDGVELVDRTAPRWTIAAVLAASYRRPPDHAELTALMAEPRLAAAWHRWLGERLAAA